MDVCSCAGFAAISARSHDVDEADEKKLLSTDEGKLQRIHGLMAARRMMQDQFRWLTNPEDEFTFYCVEDFFYNHWRVKPWIPSIGSGHKDERALKVMATYWKAKWEKDKLQDVLRTPRMHGLVKEAKVCPSAPKKRGRRPCEPGTPMAAGVRFEAPPAEKKVKVEVEETAIPATPGKVIVFVPEDFFKCPHCDNFMVKPEVVDKPTEVFELTVSAPQAEPPHEPLPFPNMM
jgi:hypothetical protein